MNSDMAATFLPGWCPGAVTAKELVVRRQLVPGPPLLTLSVTVLQHCGVFDKGHVPASLHQTPVIRIQSGIRVEDEQTSAF